MAKYSYQQIVTEYLDGQGGYDHLASKYQIPNSSPIKRWVVAYKEFDDDELKRSRNNKIYSFEKKFFIVESYLTSELSYQELALQNGINNPSMITR